MSIKFDLAERINTQAANQLRQNSEALSKSVARLGFGNPSATSQNPPERLSGKLFSGTDAGVVDRLNQAQQAISGSSRFDTQQMTPPMETTESPNIYPEVSNPGTAAVLQQAGKSAMAPANQSPSQSALNALKQTG